VNKEEKKAIKWFDTERKLVEIINGDNNYFFIILNLIDKLQKEIESKNKQIKLMQEMNLPEEIEINYISKDIIRNKIKEIAEEPQIYVDTEKFDIEFEKSIYTIDVLKELLGGE